MSTASQIWGLASGSPSLCWWLFNPAVGGPRGGWYGGVESPTSLVQALVWSLAGRSSNPLGGEAA
jgi:hypothetical protein